MNYDKILNKIFKSNNFPNILIYGIHDIDKRKILFNHLNSNYNINSLTTIKSYDVNYNKTNIYYEFNIMNNNYENIIKIIKEICISKDYYSEFKKKIIILNNYIISKKKQNILRVIIEKYYSSSVFIIITNNYGSIIEPLKSRFLCLRISSLTKKEKRSLIYKKISYKEMNSSFYDKIYDINNTDNLIDTIDIKYIYDKDYENIYNKICKKIMKIFNTKKINLDNLNKLRDITYNITKNNININHFYFVFLTELLKKQTILDKNKKKFIFLFSESQYNYIKSYRSIIVLESLIFNTFNIYNLSAA